MTFIIGSFGQMSPAVAGGAPLNYSAATQKGTFDRRAADVTIPSGALFVEVVNLDIMGVVTVNGKDVKATERWHSEAFINEVDKTIEFVEEVVIQSTGVNFLFRVSYPQSSAVDPNTI